jgi:hypothetical protein
MRRVYEALPAVFLKGSAERDPQMDFVDSDGQSTKHQPGKEAQRVGGDMRCDVSPEEERQRVMHQINKQ